MSFNLQANLPDQIKLAVKKISPPSEQREKDELKSEIGNLISLSHENLVQLLGGYSKKDLHLLIYEYMETGSLHKALLVLLLSITYKRRIMPGMFSPPCAHVYVCAYVSVLNA